MIKREFISVLVNHNFNIMRNTNPQYQFFCKDTKESFTTIVLIDDIKYPNKTDSVLLGSIKDSLEKTFLLRGYKNVDILFIIFTTKPFDYRTLAESDFAFWLSDMNQQRIISYASNDLCFSDIRSDLENALSIENSSLTNRFYDKYIKNKPTFAILFAIINIAIFIGIELFASIEQANYLYNFACMKWYSILEYGEYYRLFTCMFMHFGLTHLSSNMISLVALGSQLEPDIGHLKFIIIYIGSGLCASLTSLYYHAQMEEPVISAGASGAIYGLFGAYVIYSLFGKLKGNVAATKIALISVLMLLNGMSSVSIDNAAHLGGIISGCLIAFICCICSKNKI